MCRWFWKNVYPFALTASMTLLAPSAPDPLGVTSTAKYGLPLYSLYWNPGSPSEHGSLFASSSPSRRMSGLNSSELKSLIICSSLFSKGSDPVKGATSGWPT